MDYNYNFQDNIPAISFNSTSKNILEWIQQNRSRYDWAKDPNAYEMTNLFLFGAKYASEGKDIDLDSLTQMWNIRSQDFKRCDVSNNSFIYAICQDAYQAAINGKSIVNDEHSHSALRKLAGIGLFLNQQNRDLGSISYNNPQELLHLLECSSTLQVLHPDLYEKYGFQKNLEVLCRLQLSQELSAEVSDSIKSSLALVSNRKVPFSPQKASPNLKNYLCSKIINDSEEVCEFLQEYEDEINSVSTAEHKYVSPASNYYYSLKYELSDARSKLVKGSSSLTSFEDSFDSIYDKYEVDLDLLQDTVDKIADLKQEPNTLDRQELINALENMALAYSVNKKSVKETHADGRN